VPQQQQQQQQSGGTLPVQYKIVQYNKGSQITLAVTTETPGQCMHVVASPFLSWCIACCSSRLLLIIALQQNACTQPTCDYRCCFNQL
jgi:hypothetical protein